MPGALGETLAVADVLSDWQIKVPKPVVSTQVPRQGVSDGEIVGEAVMLGVVVEEAVTDGVTEGDGLMEEVALTDAVTLLLIVTEALTDSEEVTLGETVVLHVLQRRADVAAAGGRAGGGR